jgi:hypothetical protein
MPIEPAQWGVRGEGARAHPVAATLSVSASVTASMVVVRALRA